MARVKEYLRKKKRYQAGVSRRQLPIGAQEYICQCPRCLTLETLWFKGDFLIPTTKFSQGEDGRVYHCCNRGSAGPRRLFPMWGLKH